MCVKALVCVLKSWQKEANARESPPANSFTHTLFLWRKTHKSSRIFFCVYVSTGRECVLRGWQGEANGIFYWRRRGLFCLFEKASSTSLKKPLLRRRTRRNGIFQLSEA